MSIFGRLLPTSAVETAVLNVLSVWVPTYVAEVERQNGLTVPTLARPRSMQTSYDFDNWGEAQLPAIICVCPGTASPFGKDGDGSYSAWFEVQLGVLVEDTSEGTARKVAQLFQIALEGVLMQRGSLGGFASDTVLMSRQSRLPDVANRTLAYAESTFNVFVDNVVTEQGGPPTPDPPFPDPTTIWPDWQSVNKTTVVLEALEIDEGMVLPEMDLFPNPTETLE